jgi:hypothetical protein
MRKFRTAVYARMEEMSFRSGAVAGAGALAAAGTAIALAITLTGHSAAATSIPGPTAPARSAPSAPPAVTPSVNPSSTPVRSASPTASHQAYAPASRVTIPQATSSPPAVARLGPPRRPPRRLPVPGRTGIPSPLPPGWPF